MVCGLGNPGSRYAFTRHNVGFMVVERFAEPFNPIWLERWSSRVTKFTLQGKEVVVVAPQTFMNLSGEAIGAVTQFFNVAPHETLVVHDDAELALGRVLMKLDGGHGGHKGIQSVTAALGTADFVRLRVGIGRPKPGMDLTDYVLGEFCAEERPLLEQALARAIKGIHEWVVGGLGRAQTLVNRREDSPKPSCPEPKSEPGPQDRKEVS